MTSPVPYSFRKIHATVPVGRNVFSWFPIHDRIAIVPGRDRIPVPADLIQGLWTEIGGTSVNQDPGFVAEYETPVERLVDVKCAIQCERSKCLWCQLVWWGLLDDCRMSREFDHTRRRYPPEGTGSKSIRG